MQNDMLKNNIAPWQERGRWYHAHLSSNGTAYTLDKAKSDTFFSNSYISGQLLVIPTDEYTPVDLKVIFKNTPISIVALYDGTFYPRFNDTTIQVVMSAATTYNGEFELWIYAVKIK